MKILAIIPARGGSKRIPSKNIKPFLGKPIISYSIEVALKSGLFNEVMVSTDDQKIKKIAMQFGAKVPFMRSNENSGDFATTSDVILEVLEQYEKKGQTFGYICCIYPTAPFISTKLLKESFSKLKDSGFDSVLPVLPFSFPIQRAFKILPSERVKMFHPEHIQTRSQDLEPAYHDCGQFYWIKTDVLKKNKKLWTDNTGIIVLSELEAHDIDTEQDWKIAEFKYQFLQDAEK